MVRYPDESAAINLSRPVEKQLRAFHPYAIPRHEQKVEQRNGRVDRHGQARDVTVHHFMTDQDEDLSFLAHVLRKAAEIREDLGSSNELFDEAAHRRLVEGESLFSVKADLDRGVASARGRAALNADDTAATGVEGQAAGHALQALSAEIDLDPAALRDTLEAAMAIRVGRPQLDCTAAENTCKVLNPSLPGWSEVIDESLRRCTGTGIRGPVARVAFSPDTFLKEIAGRFVFRPRSDISLMHLSHPMMQRAFSALTRRRFPGTGEEVSRWTVRLGGVPPGAQALVLLSVEELAVNDLRETFHHWVRTVAFPVEHGALGQPLAHRPAVDLRPSLPTADSVFHSRARDLIDDLAPDLKRFLIGHADQISAELRARLSSAGEQARTREDERYRSRQGEVSSLIAENTLAKLEREIAVLREERRQGLLFDEEKSLDVIDRSIEAKQEEIARRTRHYEEVREQLERERERILKHLLPKRHAMAGPAQVFPVSIEVRLPGAPT
jgi:hypothetical protein